MCKREAEKTEEEIAAEALAAKKAAKRARKAAAVAQEEAEGEDPEAAALAAKKAAKKAKKAAAATAGCEEAEGVDPEAAAIVAKAAKKAKKAAAAAAAEAEVEEEEDPEAARAAKKAAKKAAKAAAAAPAPKKEEPPPAFIPVTAADDEFKDQTYKCCDCSGDWVDTADDQQFRWDKGFAETPRRCKDCRWAKKVRLEGGDPTAKGKGKGKAKGNKELEIFIGGLPSTTTEDVLRKDFEECGQIVNFRMLLNDEGNCRGIAFCEYTDKESVEKALKFHETEYGGRYLSVKMSGDDAKGKGKGKDGKGKGKGNKEFEVFLGGLPFSTTEEGLKEHFGECGEFVNFRMPLNDEGNPRGIAFVEFKDKEACEKALKLHETDYGGRSLSVKMSGDGGDKGKGKGKGKKGKKGKAPSEAKAKNTGCIVAGAGEKKTFSDSEAE